MQHIVKVGEIMQYDLDLFGAKQDVTTSAGQYLYSVATKNCNLYAGLKSEDLALNDYMPDSMFYWLIGKKSPYCRYTIARRSGAAGSYTWSRVHTEDTFRNAGVALSLTGLKQNATTGNIDSSGTASTDYVRIPNRRLSESMFTQTGSATNPLWYQTEGLTGDSLYRQSRADIITDFDYRNIILKIKVNNLDNVSTYDLANYNNTSSNWITGIGYTVYAGVVDDSFTSRVLTSTTGRYINGTNYSGSSGTQNGACIFTDFQYATPNLINSWYDKYAFSFPKHLTTQSFGSMVILGGEIGSSTTFGLNYYMDPDHWELSDDGSTYRLIKHGEDIYNEDDFNYIRECIAYLGFWFTDGGQYNGSDRTNALLGDNANDYADPLDIPDKVYQAEIKDGVTTGKFTELAQAKDNDQSKWGTDWREKNGYNGRSSNDRNTDRGNLSTTLHRGTIAAGCKWYALSEAQLNSLMTWMNSGYQPASNDQFVNDFKGTNPADYITSVTFMPCYPVPAGTDEQINIGPLSTLVQGRRISYEYGVLISVGSITLTREYEDFRDYKPYTSISLYVPYCGTIELDPANYYGRTINVKMMIDISTGSCTGLVFANDLLIDSISGQCGISIPLAAFNMAEYQKAIVNAQYQLKAAERQQQNAMLGLGVSMVGGTLTATTGIGLAAGIVGSIYSYNKMVAARDTIDKLNYDIEHLQPKQTQISSGSPTNTQGFEHNCRLIITRPADMIEDPEEYAERISIYGHTIGYMTNKQGIISDFHGFTQCSNVDLSGIPLTNSEISAIHEALKKGVYLP